MELHQRTHFVDVQRSHTCLLHVLLSTVNVIRSILSSCDPERIVDITIFFVTVYPHLRSGIVQ